MRSAALDRAAADDPTPDRARTLWRRVRANLGVALAIVFLLSLIAAALAPDPLAPLRGLRPGDGGRLSWLVRHLVLDPATLRLWTDLLQAAWPTLSIALAAAAGATAIGAPIGWLAGARATAWIGRPLHAALAIVEAFPPLLLALVALVAFDALQGTRPDWAAARATALAAVLALLFAPRPARIVADEMRRAGDAPHLAARRALGASTTRILLLGVTPQGLRTAAVAAAGTVGAALLMETTLSFLGLGMPPGAPSWGTLLAAGLRPMLAGSWLPVVAPTALLLLTVCALELLARALRIRLVRRLGP
jgi:peptide/nickel transport system permease protein